MSILNEETEKLLNNKSIGYLTVAQAEAHEFLNTNSPLERGLRQMILGLESYLVGLDRQFGTPVGEDMYIAPLIEEIGKSLRYLLSGPGKFDGGVLDATISRILTEKGKMEIY